ncbi:MAG: hypothetical protein Q8922_15255 [Bacteroidota bacterium]|nr:hypothetical protein [Bacteroidota bacterium]MDP4234059.1 hypothetical protein [Bacteroidota bacterium]MDP4242925.1 hypothetical protein [Bacteroidota bacterium]MDP4289274.1 hypothetical protein [Bacteroidota bacterium]
MHTRTSVWRSKYDNDYHNLTIKAVHERFGGKFTSDAGEGEYIPYDGFVREKAEAACYYAESRFQNAIVAAGVLLNAHKESDAMIDRKLLKAIPQLAGMQPPLIVYNLLAPYLVSCIEDFFRSVYVGLLTYSPRKQGVFKSARLSADDMVAVSEGLLKVEDAVAKSMTFQNVKRIAEYYREVDPQIDLLGILRRPSNRARSGLDKRLEDLIGRRHLLIHQNVMSPEYFVEEVRADIKCLELTVKRTLSSLRRHYHWQPGYPD